MESQKTVDDGVVTWKLEDGSYHREDGPALYYLCEDGSESTTGSRWYLYGVLHRIGGPAVIYANREEWWVNGKRHREDGPAVIEDDAEYWWFNGQRHREGGPAIVNTVLDYPWWVDNQANIINSLNNYLLTGKELAVYKSYDVWMDHGRLHREDGPAVVCEDGSVEYWVDDVNFTEEEYRNWQEWFNKDDNSSLPPSWGTSIFAIERNLVRFYG